ncbi:MAG: glutamate--tRNA ligase, partial [Gemmatimonadetes bacterium]|nr:glutamate--tRNA ligase [Gemmatimonadota bacterium]
MSQVRVRFAPSPTGYFHVGGARTALFNWIYARQHDGVFVLRIEDTDRERSTEESVAYFIEGLEWLGLDPDEGPYFQGERSEAHKAAVDELLAGGHAYRDFLTPEELTAQKEAAQAAKTTWRFDPAERGRSSEDSEALAAEGKPFVVRFRVPEGETVAFDDLVYGENKKASADIDDFVLLRTDGSPLYNLSVVVDDADMRISHVIRGQDHLSNTPKQILLYRALGKDVPRFGHLPLILAPNKAKLSKRKHGEIVSLNFYRDRGFLPDAFANFMALLGWSPGAEDEKLTHAALIEKFDLAKVNKSNAIFNYNAGDERYYTDPRAISINAQYLQEMPVEDLAPLVEARFRTIGLWRDEWSGGDGRTWFLAVLDLIRERYRTLHDFEDAGRAFFADDFAMDEKAVKKNLQKEGMGDLLTGLATALEAVDQFDLEHVEAAVRAF